MNSTLVNDIQPPLLALQVNFCSGTEQLLLSVSFTAERFKHTHRELEMCGEQRVGLVWPD